MKHYYNDGGRKRAGFKGGARDCAVRAVAIVIGKPYREVYDGINFVAKIERAHKGKFPRSQSRNGVYRQTLNRYLENIGWEWIPTMQFGKGCTTHMRKEELPSGSIIVRLSRHFAAVINGVLYDTYDCSREGTRCVYGYWRKKQ